MTNSQKQQVLDILEAGGTITPMQAYEEYGITRLGAIIFDLRQEGYPIDDVNKTVHGRAQPYSRYKLYSPVEARIADMVGAPIGHLKP